MKQKVFRFQKKKTNQTLLPLFAADQKPRQQFSHAFRHTHQELRPPGPLHPPSTCWAIYTQVVNLGLLNSWKQKRDKTVEQVTAKMSSDTDVHLLKICLCCCYRDETGALSGDEASRNHGGVSAAKRSESPNSFLDQESRRREEEEPVYCTTPTYGSLLSWLSVCVRGRNKARGNRVQSHAAELSHFRKNKNHYLSMNPPAGPA